MLEPFRHIEWELEQVMYEISASKRADILELWDLAYKAREILRECGDRFRPSMLKDRRPHSTKRKEGKND